MKDKEKIVDMKNLESKVWYRILKVFYIGVYLLLAVATIFAFKLLGIIYTPSQERNFIELGREVRMHYIVNDVDPTRYAHLSDAEIGEGILIQYPYQNKVKNIQLRSEPTTETNWFEKFKVSTTILLFGYILIEVIKKTTLYIILGRKV